MNRLRDAARRAFTLVELLVVISILVLILAIAVPAFSSLVYTSDQSMAENALRSGLAAARDAAARSASGQDGGAVFVFDQGRISIVPVLKAGTVLDNGAATGADIPVEREVFAPVPGIVPLQLPRLWMVRGYAPAGTIDDEWYEVTHPQNVRNRGNWLFPETSFYDLDRGDNGFNRQTFMVRFEGGTGRLKTADPTAVLVLLPSPAIEFRRTSTPWSVIGFRADREADGARFVRRVAASSMAIIANNRPLLLGDEASDTVLTRPVSQLAIYNEKRLASALGTRISEQSGCLYRPFIAGDPGPQYVPMPSGIPAGQESTVINAWIEDRLPAPGPDRIRSDARVFSVHTYLGWLQELTGTFDGATQ